MMDVALAAQHTVERHLAGDDRDLVLQMLFGDVDAAEVRRDVPLSKLNEGTPVPPELRAMVAEYVDQGYENAAIQEMTGLSRQAVSGVVSGYRKRLAKERATA